MNKVKVEIREPVQGFPYYVVLVSEFKFDTIRQESYWVTNLIKKYKRRSDAVKYASRFNVSS